MVSMCVHEEDQGYEQVAPDDRWRDLAANKHDENHGKGNLLHKEEERGVAHVREALRPRYFVSHFTVFNLTKRKRSLLVGSIRWQCTNIPRLKDWLVVSVFSDLEAIFVPTQNSEIPITFS